MLIKFWGVRGSIPVPGKDTVEFGGNTTCIEVITRQHRLIFDAGSGIRLLGLEMMQQEFGDGKGKAHIFFTHFHWDHIQGFPFFAPAYVGKRDKEGNKIHGHCNELNLHGASDIGKHLEATLCKQMDSVYFPVDIDYLSSKITFNILEENQIALGTTKISAIELNHPNSVLGYRIEDNGKIIAIATDCEHPSDGTIDQNLLKLSKNADILVYDGQYTPEEYAPRNSDPKNIGKQGFGHSTPEEGVKAIKASSGKHLIITHHDPLHSDQKLLEMEKNIRKLFAKTDFAREGMTIEI